MSIIDITLAELWHHRSKDDVVHDDSDHGDGKLCPYWHFCESEEGQSETEKKVQ